MVTSTDLADLLTTGLKIWFHDGFLSSEMITTALTQSAAAYQHVGQLRLDTGVQEGSEIRANYERSFFNPRYGSLRFKVRLNSAADVDMFIGFRSNLTAPTWGMTESCAGLFINNKNDADTLYFYTGNGDADHPNYQATPIMDIDLTRWLIFQVDFYKVRWYSLPYTVPYFDANVLPGLKQGIIRKWSKWMGNASVLPADEMHYISAYIKNLVGSNRNIDLQFFNYSEVYPD